MQVLQRQTTDLWHHWSGVELCERGGLGWPWAHAPEVTPSGRGASHTVSLAQVKSPSKQAKQAQAESSHALRVWAVWHGCAVLLWLLRYVESALRVHLRLLSVPPHSRLPMLAPCSEAPPLAQAWRQPDQARVACE